MSTAKGIGSFGSTALLVSSMTGPGLSTIPALFQQSGWAAPVFLFIVIAFLSGCSALFTCEALSNIRGNDKFQAKVELTTIAQVYLGRKYHYVFQVLLFLSLQSVNVASIIIAAQTFDSMLITIFKGTCGLGVAPGGWFCISGVESSISGNSPFNADDYYIFTFGFLLTAVLVIPLGFFTLVDNIIVQMTSFIVLIGILIQWIVAFFQEGLDTSLLPASGSDSTMVLGIVIFNYSFITTIPSWVNSLSPNVNIHKCMWVSVLISTFFYLILGICGAMAFKMDPSSDILTILSASGSTASIVTAYLFPVCALITSIPVFTIVIKSNLLRGEICSPAWATFWSNFLPWLICIPLQTKDWIGTLQNWCSLFFQSTVNFILPFVLYFVSRKYIASVEPIEPETVAPHQDEKLALPTSQVAMPSPILNYDDNDVHMFNPDDNYSISIRRSSIKHSKHSQLDHSQIATSPYMNKDEPLPEIVYSEIEGVDEKQTNKNTNLSPRLNVPSSPNLRTSPRLQHQQLQTKKNISSPSSPRNGPLGGLGISDPVSDDKNTVPGNNTLTIPGSPRNTNASNTEVGSPRSPEITPAEVIKPSRSFHSSIVASAFSFRSSAVAPIEEEKSAEEGKDMECQTPPITPEEVAHEQNRFIAFHSKPWFNPFYLAIVSCAVLSVSILFMIIFDLTMLGLGNDVFG